ncbi:tRNA pseudouridine(55) synthase TruB [bacterium D16-51]|nr:tRNA pseudouridine(55) synthase TruB [bacterium D16-59]RKI56923.1 tRNA pseudouridine(55) synthase TruB [bacterium D16-51]
MDGIINVYKEAGFTSHDVVAKLRGVLGQKKIGHTGTLDPIAAGVLPVCCGKATKVCELLADRDKTYQAVCQLGIVTDTQDITGAVLEENSVKNITEEEVAQAAASFLGESTQLPPMYSAVKVNGRKLYELAREGKTVERNPRPIMISQIDILQMNLEEHIFSMEVTCSKGTYIRTLCHDIGQKLGVGAALQNLVRTRVGNFMIGDALTIDEIEHMYREDREAFFRQVSPVDSLFEGDAKVRVKEACTKKLLNGNILKSSCLIPDKELPADGADCLVYDAEGNFRAVYRRAGSDYTVIKMF